jgi:hypothetical protein
MRLRAGDREPRCDKQRRACTQQRSNGIFHDCTSSVLLTLLETVGR